MQSFTDKKVMIFLSHLQVIVIAITSAVSVYGQINDGELTRLNREKFILLTQSGKWCLFREFVNTDTCNSLIQQLRVRSSFAKPEDFQKALCMAILEASNYYALGNITGFAEGGTLAFDGEMSIRSVMNQNGSCMLYTGEYPTGYQHFTTGDTKNNCTNMVLNNVEGKWIVASSKLIRCERKSQRLPKSEVQKRVGVLRPNRLVGSSFILSDIAIPKQ